MEWIHNLPPGFDLEHLEGAQPSNKGAMVTTTEVATDSMLVVPNWGPFLEALETTGPAHGPRGSLIKTPIHRGKER